jgi:hypothetical protein
MLALQFVLGMLLNLLDDPTKGGGHTVYVSMLVLHIINAIGLAEGGIYIGLRHPQRLAWWAAAVVALTFTSGILTVRTQQDAWSFAMACGFIVSAWLYGMLYVAADRKPRTINA